MASGDVVGSILMSMPPGSSRADPGIRAGGSSPTENWPIIAFDDSSTEYCDFLCALEGYEGGGLTIEHPWMAASATSGDSLWGMAIRRLADDTVDLDASHSYAFNTSADTAASVAGELSYPTITFTDGADMDSVAAGEYFRLRLTRDSADAADTMNSNDAEFISLEIRET